MNISIDNITGVVVAYNTKKLLKRAINSIRLHYPTLKIIIIDGSKYYNDCYKYVKKIEDEFITTIHVNKNIGHGKGLDLGIHLAETEYILCFDSDIEMLSKPLESMLSLIGTETFGVGEIQFINKLGLNIPKSDPSAIKYLHPYFQLINKRYYKTLPSYAHHGAPCIYTMLDFHNKNLSEKALIDFPVNEFIFHNYNGTSQNISIPRFRFKYLFNPTKYIYFGKFIKNLYEIKIKPALKG